MIPCPECGTAVPDNAEACSACGKRVGPTRQTIRGRPSGALVEDELLMRVRRELARDYEVHAELGRGGMAVVYRATELELLRPVALKVLPPELGASATMAERFRREARLAASFDHPNIIPIYRVGQAGGVFYIAMKFVEGKPLDALIHAQGPLPVPVVLLVLRSVARALAFAHGNGIIHRDIKGANVLVDQDGRVVVSDFGIARATEDAGMTATGTLMGTPYFMSPEQCAGHRVSQQSDQYSLGVVAFQMLTGTVPFHAETIPGVMHHHFFTPVPDIAAVRTDIPEPLLAVVNRALAKRAGDRFATTADMLAALDAIPFDDALRARAERMLRDLVLGVALPKVHAGALPPLMDTMLMTPPVPPRQDGLLRRRAMPVAIGVAVVGMAVAAYALVVDTPTAAVAADPPRAGRVVAPGSNTASPAAPASADSAPAATATAAPPAPQMVRPRAAAPEPGVAASPPAAEAPAPRASGRLRLRVLPSEAEILVDGRVLGRGVVLDSLILAGTRRLQARAAGYQPFDSLIAVSAGETSQIGTIRLTPLEGRP